uniref:G-protein coupled receptors family 1 profile domain-containing protein n=1 Tax=Panagrolaimus sp. ES5 TaxID=591445 RepID=A0AC34FGZ3_9BILA
MFYHAHLELPIINSLITASALCLVVMTVDRYLSIRYPIVFHNSSGARSRIRNTVFLLYFIAFIVFLPSGIQKVLVGSPDSEDALNRTLWRVERNLTINRSIGFIIYLYFRETIARIGPIIILVVLNLGMIRSLQQIDDTRRARASAAAIPTVARQLRQREDRRRILILLFITSATFVLCTLPASALSFFIDHSHKSVGLQIFRAFANCLQVSHYLPHLFLYMLCSIEYRHAFYKLIGCDTPNSAQTTADSPTYRLSSTVIGRVRCVYNNHFNMQNMTYSKN